MGTVYELQDSGFTGIIEDDTLAQAVVVDVKQEEKPWKTDDGKPVVKVNFKFKVTDETVPFDGQFLWGDTPTTFSTDPRCKFRNWAEEILGMEFPLGYRLNTDVLIDRPVRVVIGLRTYEKNGRTEQRNYVKDCLRDRSAGNGSEPF